MVVPIACVACLCAFLDNSPLIPSLYGNLELYYKPSWTSFTHVKGAPHHLAAYHDNRTRASQLQSYNMAQACQVRINRKGHAIFE